MLRNDRIYKSMNLNDFMSNASFIVAKGGLLLTPYIQKINYEKTLPRIKDKEDHELKQLFIDGIIKIVSSNLEVNISITDMVDYYDVWTQITDAE